MVQQLSAKNPLVILEIRLMRGMTWKRGRRTSLRWTTNHPDIQGPNESLAESWVNRCPP